MLGTDIFWGVITIDTYLYFNIDPEDAINFVKFVRNIIYVVFNGSFTSPSISTYTGFHFV